MNYIMFVRPSPKVRDVTTDYRATVWKKGVELVVGLGCGGGVWGWGWVYVGWLLMDRVQNRRPLGRAASAWSQTQRE